MSTLLPGGSTLQTSPDPLLGHSQGTTWTAVPRVGGWVRQGGASHLTSALRVLPTALGGPRPLATDEDAEAQGGHRAAQGHTAGRAQSGDPPPGLWLLGKHCSLQASERQEPKEVRSK